MDANITKAVTLLKEMERDVITNPDDRLSYRAAEGAIELLPSYNNTGGNLDLLDLPLAVIPVPAGGTLEDYINAVIYSPEMSEATK